MTKLDALDALRKLPPRALRNAVQASISEDGSVDDRILLDRLALAMVRYCRVQQENERQQEL